MIRRFTMKLFKKVKWMAALTGLLFLIGLNLVEGAVNDKERYEEKFAETVSLARDGEVNLANISGHIEVKTWDKGEVRIDALKISKASSVPKAKENAAKVKIVVEKEGNTLKIKTEYPDSRKGWKKDSINVAVNYNLMIPAKASAKITSVSGKVDLEAIGGAAKVEAVSGDVTVKKADKGVDCDAVSGDIVVQDVTGDAYLKAISGKINAEGIRGSIKATVVSGKIELVEVSAADNVEASAVSGTIVYEGKISRGGRYTLNSHSGSVEMVIPSDSGFEFEATTFSGRIHSDFEVKISGEISKRKISGVVNNGGAVVKLKTFSGNVYLKKR
jgi:hypothetical protein